MHRKSDCNSALGLFGVLGLISFLTVRPIITFLHSLLLTDGIKTAWNSNVAKQNMSFFRLDFLLPPAMHACYSRQSHSDSIVLWLKKGFIALYLFFPVNRMYFGKSQPQQSGLQGGEEEAAM